MSEDDITSLRLKIEGYVQGVGFRYYVVGEARKLGIDGWVRNSFDGSVEVLCCGPNEAVETFVGRCMRGPPSARVSNVELHKAEPLKEKGFKQIASF
jgi:acylphosphatase